MDGEDGGGRLVVRGRVEIDTRAPFKSVKEAVVLFGERVLVGGIQARRTKEMEEAGESRTRAGAMTAAIGGTKQSPATAKEENGLLAFYLQSLTDELERTKQELEKLKATGHEKPHPHRRLSPATAIPPDAGEDHKLVENNKEHNTNSVEKTSGILQKKRCVKFATPLESNRIIVIKDESVAQKPSPPPASVKRPKKKALGALIGWLFAKKKAGKHQEARCREF